MSVSSFKQEDLAKGLCVELEHTSCWWTSMRIAMDHLVEYPDYYEALEEMESSLKSIQSTKKRVLR